MNIKLYFFACFYLYNQSFANRPWQFSSRIMQTDSQFYSYSQSLAQLEAQYPQLSHISTNSQTTQKTTVQSLYNLINVGTAAYVLFKIVRLYQKMYMSESTTIENRESYFVQSIKKFLMSICPTYFSALGKQSSFLIHALAITFTALIYKTILKLIIYSADGDLFDAIEKIVSKLVKIIKISVKNES